MDPEKILQRAAVFLAAALAIVLSLIWSAGAAVLLWKGDRSPSSRCAGDEGAPLAGRGLDQDLRRIEREARPDRFHEDVLRDTFGKLTIEEAVALVGILHSFRVEARRLPPFPPLELREALETVSSVSGWDRRWLRRGFVARWGELREGPLADRLALRLAEHPWVRSLVEVPDLPGGA